MRVKRSLGVALVLAPLAIQFAIAGVAAEEAVAVIRQTCVGYGGPYACYTSLAAWEADYGGIDFGAHESGDLAAADKVAVVRIEGTWTQPDTASLSIGGWETDDEHYIKIYTASEARHAGTPGSGYRLQTTGSRPIYSTAAYLRIEGLEIHGLYAGTLVYLNPGTAEGVGEIHLSHNLIHGDGANSGSGIYNYTCRGVLKIWNNIIYDVGTPGYAGGIQNNAGTAYVYNNTIVDVISGFAIRSNGQVVARNNLTEALNDDFYGGFAAGTDFNASSDGSAIGPHSRRNQTFTFVNRAGDDFHLAPADAGARNYGQDLSADAALALADDVDGDGRSGGWDIGADESMAGSDTAPPVRLDGSPSGTLPSDTVTVTLSLATNEAATCRYAPVPGVLYADMTEAFSTTGALTHTRVITGLHDEQTYAYYVRCQDAVGNPNTDDYEVSFYIFSSDTTPPLISNVQVMDVTPYSARITWDTDEDCTSQVAWGETVSYGHVTPISGTRVSSHTVTLAGLDPATLYHFRVRSQDVAYNETVSDAGVFTTTALSNLYYVDQNAPNASDSNPGTLAEPWLTIQHGADVAQPGDTVLVYPGDYGRVTIAHGGAPGQYITFKGVNVPDRSLVDPDALFDPAHPVQVPGNPAVNAVTGGFAFVRPYGSTDLIRYVRVENFEITRIYRPPAPTVGRGGVYLANTDHVEVVRNFVHDINPNPSSYNYVGIRGDNHANFDTVVKENVLYRVQGTGINIMGRDWLVEGNEMSHGLDTNTDSGIQVGGDSDTVRFFGSGHVIRHNYLHDNLDEEQSGEPHIDCFQTFSDHPDTQFAYYILIEGNYCGNVDQIFNVGDPSENAGTGNKIHHLAFYNNVFVGARAFAMTGSGADHLDFVNNVVANSGYGAINLLDTPYLTVLNNIFYNNGSGAQVNDEASKVGLVWDYNIHYPDFTWPPKQPEFDQHSLFGVDPRFVDPGVGDFHLRVDSPAMNAGTALTTFNYDQDHVSRPQGAAWDIGAYESTPTLLLRGRPGNETIYLDWVVNIPDGIDGWRIDYYTQTASAPFTATIPLSVTRSYTLTENVYNYHWYTVTLHAMLGETSWLSDTVRVMPTDRFVYLPLVLKD